jgi:hypothetical protein
MNSAKLQKAIEYAATPSFMVWGRTEVECRQLRYVLKNKAVFRPWNALFTVDKMHLREKAAWCKPGGWRFLKSPFLVSKVSI